jgi:hypothetical protein
MFELDEQIIYNLRSHPVWKCQTKNSQQRSHARLRTSMRCTFPENQCPSLDCDIKKKNSSYGGTLEQKSNYQLRIFSGIRRKPGPKGTGVERYVCPQDVFRGRNNYRTRIFACSVTAWSGQSRLAVDGVVLMSKLTADARPL